MKTVMDIIKVITVDFSLILCYSRKNLLYQNNLIRPGGWTRRATFPYQGKAHVCPSLTFFFVIRERFSLERYSKNKRCTPSSLPLVREGGPRSGG